MSFVPLEGKMGNGLKVASFFYQVTYLPMQIADDSRPNGLLLCSFGDFL